MKFFLNCTEANHVCDKNQYHEAGLGDNIMLNIHLIYCSVCRKYSMRNNRLTKFLKRSSVKVMPLKDKIILKNEFQEKLNN